MTVGKICSRETHLAEGRETVEAAAQRMLAAHVGTLVVLDEEKNPVGILTDRDLVLRVTALAKDPKRTFVADVMTRHPRTVTTETPIEDALAVMRSLGIRRLPVVDESGRLCGILSVDDVLELIAEELEDLGRVVRQSRPGNGSLVVRPEPRRVRRRLSGLEKTAADLEC